MPPPNAALRAIRDARGLTVRQLAVKAGVSAPTVSRIETGKRNGSLETLAALAAALDVEAELLGGLPAEAVA